MNTEVRAVGLVAALVGNLLLRRARRSGSAWSALLLMFVLAGQDLPRAGGRHHAVARSARLCDAPSRSHPRPQAGPGPVVAPTAHCPAARAAASGPRVRSLKRRELPLPRAPDAR